MRLAILSLAVFCLTFGVFGQNESIEGGWKRIKPLKSSKADVEKLLGNPVSDEDGFYGYRTSDAFLTIQYTARPCIDVPWGRGGYSVPQDKVLNYIVTLHKQLKLSDLEFSREKYERDTGDGHLLNYALYANKADGVGIEIYIVDEIEYVGTIHFKPSIAQDGKHRCRNVSRK